MSRRSTLVGLGSAAVLLLSACGGSPTATNSDEPAEADGVFEEVAELTGDERRERLIELAEEEGNTLSIYTSLNADIADTILPQFEEEFGITVELYRADSETILQRTLQESEAAFAGADVVETNATEMAVIAEEGLLATYGGEQRDKINDVFDYENWTASRLNIFAPAWNTNMVSADLIPTTWEDLADPKYDGILSLEVGDYDWYMALYGYFQEQGMEDAEIDQIFADMVQGAKIAKGHSGQLELLSAGEFAVVGAAYSYLTEKVRAAGAPVDDQPFVQPVIVRANGGGILKASEHPATAILFMDWYLEEGQKLMLENGLTPSIMPDGSDPLEGLEVVPVDVQQLIDEGQEWSARYDEVVKGGELLPKD